MPSVGPHKPNPIDRNANSANRMRRNFQRMSQGALNSTIAVIAPITNSGGIGLNVNSTSGPAVASGALKILLDGTTLGQSASGLKVNVIAESQVTNLVSDLASKVPTTRNVNTTAPLTGGGALSADLTLAITQASSTTNGYLSSTDYLRFSSSGGGGTSLAAADASIIFPTSSTFQVQTYHGLSTDPNFGVELYSDAACGLGPQVVVSVTLNSTSAHTTRVGVAAFLSSTSTGLTQGSNAVYGDFTLGDGSGAHTVSLVQGSTTLVSTTGINHPSSTTESVCNLIINGATATLTLNGSTMCSALIATSDAPGVGFFGDSSASVCRIRAWGASTGTAVIVSDTFPGTYNTSQTLRTQNANYESFSLTGGGGGVARTIFNISSGDYQAYVWAPSRTGRYKWGVALASPSGLQIQTGGLAVLTANSSLSTSQMGMSVMGFQPLAADPTTFFAGQCWYNSTSNLLKTNLLGSTVAVPTTLVGSYFAGSNSSVIQNTTTLIGFTPNLTMPAGFLNILGRTVRITAILGGGFSSGTFIFDIRLAGTVIWTFTYTVANSIADTWVEVLMTTAGTGTSGSINCFGKTFGQSQTLTASNKTTTCNLTTQQVFDFAGQFSVASSTNIGEVIYWSVELMG
jgi:hypothetical protein